MLNYLNNNPVDLVSGDLPVILSVVDGRNLLYQSTAS